MASAPPRKQNQKGRKVRGVPQTTSKGVDKKPKNM
jgi:hypothetical protein